MLSRYTEKPQYVALLMKSKKKKNSFKMINEDFVLEALKL